MDKEDNKIEKLLIQIELLFQTALQELKENNQTDVDLDLLSSLLDRYQKFYAPQEECHQRWQEYITELLDLLDKSRQDAENSIKKLVASDQAFNAYQKAQAAYTEEEK